MPRPRCRSFSILDVMMLVAATAFGLYLARTIVDDARGIRISPMWVSRPITYFLLPWTLAFIPIRLRGPRPSLPRLMHQPGMAACCAVSVVAAVDGVTRAMPRLLEGLARGEPSFSQTLANHRRGNSHHIGTAVAVVWLGLALGRRWRPEAGWIDRFGRAIGALWMLTLLCDWRFGRWTFNVTYRLATGNP